ncbi:hypothetical protein [Syntrophaceticus schinkii]|nr:hypothetical protein [Syntrophaceticus schinkii]
MSDQEERIDTKANKDNSILCRLSLPMTGGEEFFSCFFIDVNDAY